MYKKITIERYECNCERCDWKWISDKLPNACARCKTTAWKKKSSKCLRRGEEIKEKEVKIENNLDIFQ